MTLKHFDRLLIAGSWLAAIYVAPWSIVGAMGFVTAALYLVRGGAALTRGE